jgi:UDP-2-acetamido-3-amino-2,3-dideoxy-glucuronate N-acetyltransferase
MNRHTTERLSFVRVFIDNTAEIPESTRMNVWHFAVILAHVRMGENCKVGSGTEIGHGTVVGHDTAIGAHVFLPPNSRIGHHVFLGPGVVCTDDMHPRVNNPTYNAEPPTIDDYAAVGAGVILCPGVHIGRGARIAAGSVVTRNVSPGAFVKGVPARETAVPADWELVIQ